MSQTIILGTPFLCLLMLITKIDNTGLYTRISNQDITFPFIVPPYTKELDQIKYLVVYKEKQINFLQKEISTLTMAERLGHPSVKSKILTLEKEFQNDICNDLPNAFWDRKKHIVTLPYEPDFSEKQIPTKARPAQMKHDYLELCKK